MPKGPRGEIRPADVIGNAVMVARIAIGEVDDTRHEQPAKRRSGQAGGKARAESLSPAERKEIAKKAAAGRWG